MARHGNAYRPDDRDGAVSTGARADGPQPEAPGDRASPSGSHWPDTGRRPPPRRGVAVGLAAAWLAAGLAACGEAPTASGNGPTGDRADPIDWTGVELTVVEDTPSRIRFEAGERVRSGRLDSLTVASGAAVLRSVELEEGELVIVPAAGAHGAFKLRAHVTGSAGASTSERNGKVQARTDVSSIRLLRAASGEVAPASGALRVVALGDGAVLGAAKVGADGRSPGIQLTENRRHLVVRAITVAGGDTSFVRRLEVEVEPGEDLALDALVTETAPPGWTRAEYRRYMCDAEDVDGDGWHGVTMWEPAGMDCRVRRGDYDRVLMMAETPLVVDGRPAGTLDASEQAFVADQVTDPDDGVAILGERLPIEVLEPDADPDAWEVVEFGGVVYLRPTRPGTLLVYVDASLRGGASLARDTDGDGVRDTGFVMIGYQPRTDFPHADFTVSHELMRHAGLVGLASRAYLDRTIMSFYTPDAPADPTRADLRAAEAMRRHPPGVATVDLFGLEF